MWLCPHVPKLGNIMAIKIKKRRQQDDAPESEIIDAAGEEGPDAPIALPEPQMHDSVLDNSRTAFQWMYAHRNIVIGAVVVFLVIAGVWSLMAASKRSAQAAESSRLFAALQTAEAPVVGESAIFATVAEREAELATAAGALTGSDSPSVARFANALAARAALYNGDGEAALANMRQVAPSGPSPEDVILKVSYATAQAESGDLAGALETLDDAVNDDSPFEMAIARTRTRLIDAFGEPADALTAYRDFIDNHPTASEPESIQARIASLEMETGTEPRPPVVGATDGLPELQ
jgi:hypothetical protein